MFHLEVYGKTCLSQNFAHATLLRLPLITSVRRQTKAEDSEITGPAHDRLIL